MATLPTTCPSCQGTVTVTKLRCDHCETQLDGAFDIPALLGLSADDLVFILRFVQASGSLKEMAKTYHCSYPTIRNRLDALVDRIGKLGVAPGQERRSILDALAKGTLSVAAAERKLRSLRSDA